MIDLFIKGGPVMYPLLLCSIAALAVAIEKFYQLRIAPADSEKLMRGVKLALYQGRAVDALATAKNARGPVAGIVRAAVARYGQDPSEIRAAIERAGRNEISLMERRMAVLDAIITIAPLLGFLGTVTGIIKSFGIFAVAAGAAEPSALSAGIAEALITTAAGLSIAIPSMIAYSYLNSLVERHITDMENRAEELIALAARREEGE